jgi:hypothetical protein
MSEAWQRSPRGVAEQLVERGSVYDIDTMGQIYDGSVRRAGRAETIAMFRRWAEEGGDPLLTEAQFLHVEESGDQAVVLLRRKMRADEPSSLYELRLRRHGEIWRGNGETIMPWVGPANPS